MIFDGCKHGYNAMFCDNYSEEQQKNRTVDKIYKTVNGKDTFEVTIWTYNQIAYDDEFAGDIGEDGLIEIN